METVFLACFLFGALFSVVSLVLGAGGAELHLPWMDGPAHAGAGHVAAGGHDAGIGHHGAAQHGGSADTDHFGLPLLNASSLLAFLTWFGAAGYVLLRFAGWALLPAILVAVAVGAVGAVIVAFFIRLLLSGEREMRPRDYRMEGTIGRVTVSIPAAGTGEVVFSKGGSRRSEAARSLDGRPVPRGTEVVIIDYARGVAAVQPWEEFVAGSPAEAGGEPPSTGA